ncbi:hypothetical protein ACFLXQ_07650 [Chloroflexota bacterium]
MAQLHLPPITITVPSASGLGIPVSWPADDGLSGIRDYDVQYKKDSGNWLDWRIGITATQGTFIGEQGSSYRFKVQATDNVGNVGEWVESEAVMVDTVVKYYTFGSQRVAMQPHSNAEGDEVYYLSGDHLGSVSLTTDSAGNVESESRYLPYGSLRWTNGAAVTDFGYTSQRGSDFTIIMRGIIPKCPVVISPPCPSKRAASTPSPPRCGRLP